MNLATGTGSGGDATGDTLSGVENVTGSGLADQLTGDSGANLLSGGGGGDVLVGGAGADSLYGGSGTDTADYSASTAGVAVDLTAGTGSGGDAQGDVLNSIEHLVGSSFGDTLTGNTGNNQLSGGAGNDLVIGSTGNDTLYGGTEADSLLGEAGNDSLSGGDGNDTLSGGTGSDTLTGGLGRDVYELVASGGADRISDFSMVASGAQTEDQLDVSELQNLDGSPVKTFDVAVSDDGTGSAVLTFPGGETLVLAGVSPATAAQPGMLFSMGIPCFAEGTRILTPDGERPVQAIRPGDLVSTAEGEALPVLWHGRRQLTADDLAARPDLRPIRLRAGACGNRRELILSPQHGMVRACTEGPMLVRARHLAEVGQGARVMRGVRRVSYHHLLLPRHAVILAEGAQSESFYPGAEALAALTAADRAALAVALGLPPEMGGMPDRIALAYGPRCLPLASRRQVLPGTGKALGRSVDRIGAGKTAGMSPEDFPGSRAKRPRQPRQAPPAVICHETT